MSMFAIVTGGGSGLVGPMIVRSLNDRGYEVLSVGLPEYDFTGTEAKRKATVARIKRDSKKRGVPRVLIHAAAIDNKPGTPSSLWGSEDIMDVNYQAFKLLAEAFVDDMSNLQGVKHIIGIGSILGVCAADHRNYAEGFDKPVDYGASKRACYALIQNLSTRYAKHNILCNMLAFSAVDGPTMSPEFAEKYLRNVPLGRFLKEQDIDRAVRGILMQTAMTGQLVLIDGGYSQW